MSVREGFRKYLSDPLILRTCLYLAAGLGAALFIVWPRSALETAVRTGMGPGAFALVATFFLALLLLLEARFGAQDFSTDPTVHLQEHVRLTRASLMRLVGGRATFGFLHTLLLLLLGAPFLAASLAVGGMGLPHLFRGLAIIGAAGLASRALGLLSLCVFGTRRPLREIALYPVLVGILIATFLTAPSVSPFWTLNKLLVDAGGFPTWLLSVLADLAAAFVFFGLSVLALSAVRARAQRFPHG